MSEFLDIYKCNECGNIVQVLVSGIGNLVCCGEPMEQLKAHTSDNDELSDKHVPIFVDGDNNHKLIQIGSTLHPMSEEHHIRFVEVITNDKNNLRVKYFSPNENPTVMLENSDNNIKALAYCNIHGLWESKND